LILLLSSFFKHVGQPSIGVRELNHICFFKGHFNINKRKAAAGIKWGGDSLTSQGLEVNYNLMYRLLQNHVIK
jgi:hypothetical protein